MLAKRGVWLVMLLSVLVFGGCGKAAGDREARLKAIGAELRGMKPEEVEALMKGAAGGTNISPGRAREITLVLPSGKKVTLEEVQDGLMLEALGQDNPDAGTWEDDPKNWRRAFGEETPAGVSVVHSRYWESNHFTREYLYYFVVRASPEWRDAFLKKRGLFPVKASEARSYRSIRPNSDIPKWFVPDPVERYEAWDLPGYYGSVFIDRETGEIHFAGGQL